jgi:hypothetical protein
VILAERRGSLFLAVILTCDIDVQVSRIDNPDRVALRKGSNPEGYRGHRPSTKQYQPPPSQVIRLDTTEVTPASNAWRTYQALQDRIRFARWSAPLNDRRAERTQADPSKGQESAVPRNEGFTGTPRAPDERRRHESTGTLGAGGRVKRVAVVLLTLLLTCGCARSGPQADERSCADVSTASAFPYYSLQGWVTYGDHLIAAQVRLTDEDGRVELVPTETL